MDDTKKNVTNAIIRYTGPILSIVCFFIVLIVSEVLNSNYNENLTPSLTQYTESWVLVEEYKEESVTIPFALDYKTEKATLKTTLQEVTDEDILLFKYQYQIEEILIDDEVIYTFHTPRSGNVSTTLGTNILSISMKKEYSNRVLTLHMGVENPSKRIMIEEIYLTSRGDFLYSIFKENSTQLFIASLLLITGLIYLISYVVIKIKGVRLKNIKEEYFLSMFVFSFSTALWILTDLHLVFIITNHLVVNDILSYFSLALVPVGLVYLIYYVIQKFRPVFIVLQAIYILNIAIQTVLFTTGALDLAKMLVATHVLLFVGLFVSIGVVVLSSFKDITREKIILLIGFAIFSVFIIICIVGYLFGPIGFDYNLYFLISMTVLALVFGYIILKEFVQVMGYHAAMQQIVKFAYIDSLTGIGNRRAYEEAIVKEKNSSEMDNLAILAFDVNYLKQSNDTLGHKAGDELIIATAELLKNIFSNEEENNIFRTGGDEFCAIVHFGRDEILAKILAFDAEIRKWKGEINQSLSVATGLAFKDDYPEISLEELAIKADEEMYKNKRALHKKINTIGD